LVQVLRDRTVKVTRYVIGLSGLIISGVSLIISPTPLISGFFFGHMLFFGITHRLAYAKVKANWGMVKDKDKGKPLAKVLIRVFDAEYDKLVDTAMTDNKGRYAMLVGPAKYYVTFEKQGYATKQSQVIDFSSQATNGMGGMIAVSVELVEGESGEPKEEEPREPVIPVIPKPKPEPEPELIIGEDEIVENNGRNFIRKDVGIADKDKFAT